LCGDWQVYTSQLALKNESTTILNIFNLKVILGSATARISTGPKKEVMLLQMLIFYNLHGGNF